MRIAHIFCTHPTAWWWPTLVGPVKLFKTDWLLCTSSVAGRLNTNLPPQPSLAGQFNTNSPTQPLHYTEFIKCFRYNMYRVTLSRNLRITWSVTHVWFPFSPKYFVILSAKQRTKSTEPMFHSKKNFYHYY